MPNWCENVLVVEGPEDEVRRFIEDNSNPDAEQEDRRAISFERSLPTPPELTVPGQDGWYNWRLINWGTKWDASAAYDWETTEYGGGKLSARVEFDTAWSAPEHWVITVGLRYPELMLQLDYVEHGMQFAGEIIVADGTASVDEKDYDPADYGMEEDEGDEDEGED